jgi:hypothetical protein
MADRDGPRRAALGVLVVPEDRRRAAEFLLDVVLQQRLKVLESPADATVASLADRERSRTGRARS